MPSDRLTSVMRALRCWWLMIQVGVALRRETHVRVRESLGGLALHWAARAPLLELVKAVRRAARLAPEGSCLAQAIVAEAVLRRAGHEAEIHIGVAPTGAGHFRAHAWVLLGGQLVVGGDDRAISDYRQLTILK